MNGPLLGVAVLALVAVVGGYRKRRVVQCQRVELRRRLLVGFSPPAPLPFDAPEELRLVEPTHLGGVCPNGAAAPKTLRPGSLSARLHDRGLRTSPSSRTTATMPSTVPFTS